MRRLRLVRSLLYYLVIFAIPFSILVLPGSAQSQQDIDTSFNAGMKLYRKAKFDEAAAIFSKLSTPEANLFAGKSHFAAGRYLKAQQQLYNITENAPKSVQFEAIYTQALVSFQLEDFANSLLKIHQITSSDDVDTSLTRSANSFYKSVLSYLTLDQRKQIFMKLSNPSIRLDLLEHTLGRTDFKTMKWLVKEFNTYLPDSSEAPLQFSHLTSALSDSVTYYSKYSPSNSKLKVPEGTSYDIGVALPSFNPDRAEFKVTRDLYNGILLAAEQYNQQNTDRKVFIRYRDTAPKNGKANTVFNQLVWKHPLDAVIGPLFSESASKMASLAEQYQITLLTPLANSDTLNVDNPYVFQVNPTFSVRGRKMARYAVKRLKMDTMAVIAQKGALGYESAFHFRDEAERLGAHIAYFFVEDFASKAYDLSDYTKYFTADEQLRDSLNIQRVDGIYAPFTGQAAATLIDLLMTDLEAANTDHTLLGSAEWGAFDMNKKQISKFDMYYPEADPLNADTTTYQRFDQQYKNRFGIPPSKFSYIGYDAAQFLLESLNEVGNPALLKNAIKKHPLFKGLSGPIHFNGQHINQELDIYKIR